MHELYLDQLIWGRGVVQTHQDSVHKVGRIFREDGHVVTGLVQQLARTKRRVQLHQHCLSTVGDNTHIQKSYEGI